MLYKTHFNSFEFSKKVEKEKNKKVKKNVLLKNTKNVELKILFFSNNTKF